MAKSVLGRGMGALLEMEEVNTGGSSEFGEIEIVKIKPNPNQPRTNFNEEALEELSASIKSLGVIQPITVRLVEDGSYQIIAGERRFRASKKAGLTKIPAYIKTTEDDQHVMKMALVENIQREDLNAIEVALGYHKLVEIYKLTQEQLSELVGMKRATVANYLRLLKLPAEIQLGITCKKIDMGHARALISVDNPAAQIQLYKDILANDYTVRKVEEIVSSLKGSSTAVVDSPKSANVKNDNLESLKKLLSNALQTNVELLYNEKGKGKVVLPFNSEEDLKQLIKKLNID